MRAATGALKLYDNMEAIGLIYELAAKLEDADYALGHAADCADLIDKLPVDLRDYINCCPIVVRGKDLRARQARVAIMYEKLLNMIANCSYINAARKIRTMGEEILYYHAVDRMVSEYLEKIPRYKYDRALYGKTKEMFALAIENLSSEALQ